MLARRCLSQRQFLLRALPESLLFPTQASCYLPGNVLPGPLFVRRFPCRFHLAKRCEQLKSCRLEFRAGRGFLLLISLRVGPLRLLLRLGFHIRGYAIERQGRRRRDL